MTTPSKMVSSVSTYPSIASYPASFLSVPLIAPQRYRVLCISGYYLSLSFKHMFLKGRGQFCLFTAKTLARRMPRHVVGS